MAKLLVNVLDGWPKETVYSVEVPFSEYEKRTSIMYISVPIGANLSFLDQIPFRVDPFKKAVDCIVIRFHKPELTKLEQDPMPIQLLCQRFKNYPVYILNWNGDDHKILHLKKSAPPVFHVNERSLLRELRHAELYSLVNQPDTLLQADHDYHYIGPNGKHYKEFLRVGNALYSKDALDSISFWLLPHTKNNPLILLDSGSILSLGLNLMHYSFTCGYLKDLKGFESINCLNSYNEDDAEIIRRLYGLKAIHGNPDKIVNIFSARGTGNLAQRLITIGHDLGAKSIDNVYLFSIDNLTARTDNVVEEVFCHLPETFLGADAPCADCKKGSVPLRINDRTYALDISADAQPVSIDIADAKHSVDFFTRYPDSGCFVIHKDQADGRHHMIDIDVSVLLKHPKFQELLNVEARKISNVDVILTPEHDAAKELALFVNEVLKVPIIHCEHSRLGALNEEDKLKLKNAKSILIVDDVVQTGKRLNDYKVHLDIYGIKNEHTIISLLVGVARAESKNLLQGVKDYIYPYENFHAIEELILPNWNHEECPWCWELKKMEELGSLYKSSPMLEARYNALKSKDGLKGNLFMHWSEDGHAVEHGTQPTIFGPTHNEVEIFVSIASTIQGMREKGKLNKSNYKPIAKVYDLSRFIGGRYYENFVRASIFRASFPHDIRSSKIEIEQTRLIKELLYNADHAIPFRSELLLNIAQGKLPSVEFKDELFTGEEGVCSFLKKLTESIS